jgi:hypothetical protein
MVALYLIYPGRSCRGVRVEGNHIPDPFMQMVPMLAGLHQKLMCLRLRCGNAVVAFQLSNLLQVTGNPLSGQVSQSAQWAVSSILYAFVAMCD